MNKSELGEIKKQYGITTCGVKRIAGCYIDAEKNIISKFNETFLNKPEEEQFKYLEILRRDFPEALEKIFGQWTCPALTISEGLQL